MGLRFKRKGLLTREKDMVIKATTYRSINQQIPALTHMFAILLTLFKGQKGLRSL